VAELRALLLERIAADDVVPAQLVFDAELQQELELAKMRDHEWLDPSIHAMRTKELELIGRWAEAGLVSVDSLVTATRDLIDVKVKAGPGPSPSPKRPADAPAPNTPPAKAARH
jgi:hypothetical protein